MNGIARFFGWSLVLSLVLWKVGPLLGFDVGDFPGTVTYQSGSYGIRIPVLFCLLTSVVLTVIMRLIFRGRR